MELGLSGYCDDDGPRDKPPNLACSVIGWGTPPEPDRYGREGWFFAKVFSGVWERRKPGYSSGDGRAGAVGGDMAPGADGGWAFPYGADETGRREKMDEEPTSRPGRSASEPSMDDIDMLLPGR